MPKYERKESRITKNQVNKILPKDTNKTPITDPKEMEIYELSEKELRIILLKKLTIRTQRQITK